MSDKNLNILIERVHNALISEMKHMVDLKNPAWENIDIISPKAQRDLADNVDAYFTALTMAFENAQSSLKIRQSVAERIKPFAEVRKCLIALNTVRENYNSLSDNEQQAYGRLIDEMFKELESVENAPVGHKQWHQFISAVKSFVEAVGAKFGKKFDFDKAYKGPIKQQFWTEPKTRESVEALSRKNTPASGRGTL